MGCGAHGTTCLMFDTTLKHVDVFCFHGNFLLGLQQIIIKPNCIQGTGDFVRREDRRGGALGLGVAYKNFLQISEGCHTAYRVEIPNNLKSPVAFHHLEDKFQTGYQAYKALQM